jgi:hemolysin activation/secretion protein
MSIKWPKQSASLLVLLAFVAMPAGAQEVPPSTRPDVIEQELKAPEPPLSTEDFTLPSPGVGTVPEGVEDVRFVLNEIIIEGNGALSQAALNPIYGQLLGSEVSLRRVFEAASQITALYVAAGYALVVAFVPAQEITDGRVRIRVVEGYVEEVVLSGDFEGKTPSGLVAQRTRNIIAETPLTTSRLERELLLLNDVPGLSVRSVLDRSDATVGGTRLILDIEEKPFDISAGIDTRGSAALGPLRWNAALAFNNLFGNGTQVSANVLRTVKDKSLEHYGLGFRTTVLGGDLNIFGYASWTDSRPGLADLRLLEFGSDGVAFGLGVSHSFIRSRAENLRAQVSFDFQNSTSDFLSVANSKDKTRVLSWRLIYGRQDKKGGIWQASASLSHGLGLFNATENDDPLKSGFDDDFGFWKVSAILDRFQPLFWDMQLALRAKGQLAFDPTPIAQQCGYGGPGFGRAFDVFEIAGDHCLAFSAELRKNFLTSGSRFDDYFQPYVFFDAGKVWAKGIVLAGAEASASATSFGGGLRFSLLEHLEFAIEYAKPMDRDVRLEGNRDGRVFIWVSARF